jgi:hypothetical protein
MNTLKTTIISAGARLPFGSMTRNSQNTQLQAAKGQRSKLQLTISLTAASVICLGLLLSGCKVVKVYEETEEEQPGTTFITNKVILERPGIPFVTKKVIRKQETVWQQNLILVKLVASNEKNKIDLGHLYITPSFTNNLVSLFNNKLLTRSEIIEQLNLFTNTPGLRMTNFISNREISQTVFDNHRYYITAYRPLVGSASFAPEFNTDAMLTKLSANVEDKTVPTFLDPFKDALSTAAGKFIKVANEEKFTVTVLITQEKAVTVWTVSRPILGANVITNPIQIPRLDGTTDWPSGVEVVVSSPEEKKSEEEKGVFKFNGSVVPPKSDK